MRACVSLVWESWGVVVESASVLAQVNREDAAVSALLAPRALAARERGRRLKQVCRVRLLGGGRDEGRDERSEPTAAEATVHLEELPANHPFAAVVGSGAVLCVETDRMTPLFVSQLQPRLDDTAFGVLADLLCLS